MIAALARLQHGVLGRAQLLALGFHRARSTFGSAGSRLHLVFRGAYSVSPILSGMGRWKAATLATGPDSVLTLPSAGALWAIRPSPAGWST